jgi:ribosome-associated toxin RatA of RatAB toxin-antitoxin module
MLSASGVWARVAPGLSGDEIAQLRRGELVVRPSERRVGDSTLVGGTSYQVINASPDVVWQALLDTERYPRMMPRVLEARLVREGAKRRTIYMRQGASGIAEKRYYLQVEIDADAREIAFALDRRRPHDVHAAWGFYSVQPFDGSRTLLAYTAMADIGGGLLAGVLRGTVQEWMLKTPWMVKRFVEGSGKYIYG